ncbi:hypothetical protein Tco_1534051 [Tanacetum coccineum]
MPCNEVQFLGHVVNRDGIHVDPSKVESVKNWKTPESPTEIRSISRFGRVTYREFYSKIPPNRKAPHPETSKNKAYVGVISKRKLPNSEGE